MEEDVPASLRAFGALRKTPACASRTLGLRPTLAGGRPSARARSWLAAGAGGILAAGLLFREDGRKGGHRGLYLSVD